MYRNTRLLVCLYSILISVLHDILVLNTLLFHYDSACQLVIDLVLKATYARNTLPCERAITACLLDNT